MGTLSISHTQQGEKLRTNTVSNLKEIATIAVIHDTNQFLVNNNGHYGHSLPHFAVLCWSTRLGKPMKERSPLALREANTY